MASPKQLAANRWNAQKSTGPKTATGKAVAKMNAVKHGLLARHVVLQGQHDNEQVHEFQQLYKRYWEHYEPVGPVEEMLVEKMVTAYWRSHRALLAERGEIAQQVDATTNGAERIWTRRVERSLALAGYDLEESAMGLVCLKLALETVRDRVRRDGELTEETIRNFVSQLGGKPTIYSDKLTQFREWLQTNPDQPRAQHQQQVLAHIATELARCEKNLPALATQQEFEDEARQAAAHLPTAATLDKILRYETTLERQLYRAMNQLERLQRMRQGEVVPAPLTVDVGTNGEVGPK